MAASSAAVQDNRWQREYETKWKDYVQKTLRRQFGDRLASVRTTFTQEDVGYLQNLLAKLKREQAHEARHDEQNSPESGSYEYQSHLVVATRPNGSLARSSSSSASSVGLRRSSMAELPMPLAMRRRTLVFAEDLHPEEEEEEVDATQLLAPEDQQEEDEEGDESMMSVASDASSYVYSTPQAKGRRSSIFPPFCSQEVASQDQTCLDTVSQRLCDRLADVSPITVGRHQSGGDAVKNQQLEEHATVDRSSMILFEMLSPAAHSPQANSPRKTLLFSDLRRDEDDGCYDQGQDQEEREEKEQEVDQLDVTMKSLNLSRELDDDTMEITTSQTATNDGIEEQEIVRAHDNYHKKAVGGNCDKPDKSLNEESVAEVFSPCNDLRVNLRRGEDAAMEVDASADCDACGNNVVTTNEQPTTFADTAGAVSEREEEDDIDDIFTQMDQMAAEEEEARERERLERKSQSRIPKPPVIIRTKVPLYLAKTQRIRKKIHLLRAQKEVVDKMMSLEKQTKITDTANGSLRQALLSVRGGLLAEQMGFGKRLCCLALVDECIIIADDDERCSLNDDGTKRKMLPTLIVTSLAMLAGWEQEIKTKTSLQFLVYHGQSRKRIDLPSEFMAFDVVLATYDTLRLKECKIGTGLHGDNSWRQVPRGSGTYSAAGDKEEDLVRSKLHEFFWERVILDESLLISNENCARTFAVQQLQSKKRWCLLAKAPKLHPSWQDWSSLLEFLGVRLTEKVGLAELLDQILVH